jgi:hypothetical protein
MYPACLIGSRAVALMGMRTHLYARRSWPRPIARCGNFTPDRIQAGQLKRSFIRRGFSSVHSNAVAARYLPSRAAP